MLTSLVDESSYPCQRSNISVRGRVNVSFQAHVKEHVFTGCHFTNRGTGLGPCLTMKYASELHNRLSLHPGHLSVCGSA